MINYTEKGYGVHIAINEAGHSLSQVDGVWTSSDDTAVQAIIDSYDPLPEAQAEALEKVKDASATKRLEFVTQAAGKDAEYTFKAQEAEQYETDGTVGIYMQGRIDATGETADAVAKEWSSKALNWKRVCATLSGLEDKASADINNETSWQQCKVIAESVIEKIKAI